MYAMDAAPYTQATCTVTPLAVPDSLLLIVELHIRRGPCHSRIGPESKEHALAPLTMTSRLNAR